MRFSAGAGKGFSRHHIQTGSGTHQTSYSIDTEAPSPGVKRAGSEADHTLPSSADLTCVELYLHFPYVFMALCLIK
jgi:hypothetical protein